ncbi:hypothetical protein KFE98_16245 [bacterium SCSIO 12741]|nr:hypothetical protein KFE98_16245 [bacterium SCSIO 12741]
MKKHLLILWLGVWVSTLAIAQTTPFNTVYERPGYSMQGGNIIQLTDSTEKELVFIAMGPDTIRRQANYITNVLIVKTDSNGVVLQSIQKDTTNSVEKLLETHDNGFLHISQYYDHLEITKYDNNLSQQWATRFLHPSAMFMGGWSFDNLDAIRVYDPYAPHGQQENYYISFSSGSPDTTYRYDKNICVLKMDENGTLLWKNYYTDANRAAYGSNAQIQDNAWSLTSFESPTHHQRVIAVAGNKDIQFPYHEYYMWTFLIDENGNLLSDMQWITVANPNPDHGSILWDGDSLVLAYQEKNTVLNPDPDQVSGLAILKFDELFSGMRARYYWHSCENYPNNITLAPDGDYILNGWTGECIYTGPPYPSQMLMKIERNTLDESWFHKFSINQNQGHSGFHITDRWGWNYQVGSIWNYYPNGAFENVHVIKTDPAGRTCDMTIDHTQFIDFTPTWFTERLDPVLDLRDSLQEDYMWPVWMNEYPCLDAHGDGSRGAVAVVEAETRNDENLYTATPSLIQAGQSSWKITTGKVSEQSSEVRIFDSSSRLVYKTTWEPSEALELPVGALAKGVNLVRISESGHLLQTLKVVRID